ncbi:MAG: hypothetical protein ACLQUY_04160 [Ktedonobacterales bacterium]
MPDIDVDISGVPELGSDGPLPNRWYTATVVDIREAHPIDKNGNRKPMYYRWTLAVTDAPLGCVNQLDYIASFHPNSLYMTVGTLEKVLGRRLPRTVPLKLAAFKDELIGKPVLLKVVFGDHYDGNKVIRVKPA